MKRCEEFEFEIWQNGIMVVGVSASDLESAKREIMHYATVYAQDGPLTIMGEKAAYIMADFRDDPPMSGQPKRTIDEVVEAAHAHKPSHPSERG